MAIYAICFCVNATSSWIAYFPTCWIAYFPELNIPVAGCQLRAVLCGYFCPKQRFIFRGGRASPAITREWSLKKAFNFLTFIWTRFWFSHTFQLLLTGCTKMAKHWKGTLRERSHFLWHVSGEQEPMLLGLMGKHHLSKPSTKNAAVEATTKVVFHSCL